MKDWIAPVIIACSLTASISFFLGNAVGVHDQEARDRVSKYESSVAFVKNHVKVFEVPIPEGGNVAYVADFWTIPPNSFLQIDTAQTRWFPPRGSIFWSVTFAVFSDSSGSRSVPMEDLQRPSTDGKVRAPDGILRLNPPLKIFEGR